MLICRYCQTSVVDSTTKTCPNCGTVNALVPNGGCVHMTPETGPVADKPSEAIISEAELNRMMGLDPKADPYGPHGAVNATNGDRTIWIGKSPQFKELVKGVEVRQVAGIVSHITGIGWKNDLDIGLALLLEAQE